MNRVTQKIIFFVSFLTISVTSNAQNKSELVLKHSDQLEVVLERGRYITHVTGNVRFETETGNIYCDSAVWDKGKSARLSGNVRFVDQDFSIESDSVLYNISTKDALALGERVELWSFTDSVYAVGTHAFYDRRAEYLRMHNRPVLYLRYPDSANMIEVIADTIEFSSLEKYSNAIGNVKISSKDMNSSSGQARYDTERDSLELTINPIAYRKNSKVTGRLITVLFAENNVNNINVLDSARAEFNEPVGGDSTYIDRSILEGREIHFKFEESELNTIICYNQAYSWYFPSSREDTVFQENSVSGDTIRFLINQEQLKEVQVIGGAIGKYLSGSITAREPGSGAAVDTVDYKGRYVAFNFGDSMIVLEHAADIKSGTVSLNAHRVNFDTHLRLIEAFSAQGAADSGLAHESPFMLQPNPIPVVLADKEDEIFGDYLVYSIDTKKGRIFQSKTTYNESFYYGEKTYRENPHVFYIDDGRFTTCSADEPHFHFYSSDLKLMENNKLIARPVVFYLGRLPLLALPFYVFPLEKGRHSGLLPFTFGTFRDGDRYVRNVGYYWAATDYWDWQGSFDYIERQRTLTFNSRVNFAKRYVFNGYVSGSYTKVTDYDATNAVEFKSKRWIASGLYNHTFSPSFSLRSFADFRSDATYFDDYSINRDDRLNRDAKSQVSFSKKFYNGISISGSVLHTENFDLGTRTDQLPSASVSFPTIWPFGSSSRNSQGVAVQRWYNGFTFRYTPSFLNSSSRTTDDSTGVRSRKKYMKINHNPGIGLPTISLFKYFKFTPSFNYAETWFNIIRTDQSDSAGIEPKTYRTYSYSGIITGRTDFYGTVYPNFMGLIGLRHTLTPQISYSYSPEINKHPEVRAYAGGGAGSLKSRTLGVTISQLFQAKVRKGESEKTIDLLSLTSGFNYNYEAETRKYSNLRTTFQSNALPKISFNGSLNHSFYKDTTDHVSFWSPKLESFSVDARFTLGGKYFIFDDPADRQMPRGAETPGELAPRPTVYSPTSRGWTFSASYGYSESGEGASFNKFSFFRFNLNFNLTPTTSISYSHDYDIDDSKTLFNSVRILRTIHCWTGSLYWVPIGTNKGFGFQLFVTAIPDIKIDDKHDSYLQTIQRY